MTLLLLLFTGGCALWDLKKTPYFQWYDSGWRAAVSFNSVWSGDENRIYSRMEQVAAGNWGGAYVRHL